ncbi:hypothetical protein A5886_000862 [Enterococcus sp. 8G7_MSG3316]|uniref:Uncharacterized protein n=1 Tax=Candidatus Enterococcus testudinis TaxID=1834191 RepID=A0A242A426_9ENTE|nr:hypothetical protein A5886_000862 [Enterococcus sp. 8G7_MSG3316]
MIKDTETPVGEKGDMRQSVKMNSEFLFGSRQTNVMRPLPRQVS